MARPYSNPSYGIERRQSFGVYDGRLHARTNQRDRLQDVNVLGIAARGDLDRVPGGGGNGIADCRVTTRFGILVHAQRCSGSLISDEH
jgi:hypothetical protein